jgi:hypothetical protein
MSDVKNMKTTLEIPDAVIRRAKANAAQRGIPLGQFVTEAVEEKLRAGSCPPDKPWLHLAGQLRHLSDETVNVNRTIEMEFERIEPEEWT